MTCPKTLSERSGGQDDIDAVVEAYRPLPQTRQSLLQSQSSTRWFDSGWHCPCVHTRIEAMKETKRGDMNVRTIETSSNEELRDDWLREARRRATEWDEGVIQSIPGDEVFKKARAVIR